MNEQKGGYESEMRVEEKSIAQRSRLPKPVGDIITKEDLELWVERKKELESRYEQQIGPRGGKA